MILGVVIIIIIIITILLSCFFLLFFFLGFFLLLLLLLLLLFGLLLLLLLFGLLLLSSHTPGLLTNSYRSVTPSILWSPEHLSSWKQRQLQQHRISVHETRVCRAPQQGQGQGGVLRIFLENFPAEWGLATQFSWTRICGRLDFAMYRPSCLLQMHVLMMNVLRACKPQGLL